MSRSPVRGFSWAAVALIVVLLLLTARPIGVDPGGRGMTVGAAGGALFATPGSEELAAPHATGPPEINDGGTIQTPLLNGTFSLLSDTVLPGAVGTGVRSYTIRLSTAVPIPAAPVTLATNPVVGWSDPDQLPGGADNLPPLPEWGWSVARSGVNDTANWTVTPDGAMLERTVGWVPGTWVVTGHTSPLARITVDPSRTSDLLTTRVGVVLNDPNTSGSIPANDPDYSALLQPLHPAIVRWSMASIGTEASWDVATNAPRFNFSGFDAAYRLASGAGASVMVSLPAGTWGDGNILPTAMPVDATLAVPFRGSTGHFPDLTAYRTYVLAIAGHAHAAGETVDYWNVGNEMPLVNASIVGRYIEVFNAAESAIHSVAPSALVGSDVMMNRTYFATFAAAAHGVGYLSFHYYPATGICTVNGSYCPPQGGPVGTTDPDLFRPVSGFDHLDFVPPRLAGGEWAAATGATVPVLDTESNLNGAGGSLDQASVGTDPRQQTLLGGSWLTATLMNASTEGVSELTYFTLTAPSGPTPTITARYGGWGFGLTTEGAGDQDVHYAPYWALDLWSAADPSGGAGLSTSVSGTSVVRAYATGSSGHLRVVVVDTAAVPVRIEIAALGMPAANASVELLDNRSYSESFDPTTQTTTLRASGVTNLSVPANGSFVLGGYGSALFVEGAPGGFPFGTPPTPPSPALAILGIAVAVAVGAALVVLFAVPRARRRNRRLRRVSDLRSAIRPTP